MIIGHVYPYVTVDKSLDENYPEKYQKGLLPMPTGAQIDKVAEAYEKYFKEETVKEDKYNPKHYTDASIEPIDVIESWGLGFHLGNCLKYIKRAGRKERESYEDDLNKCKWYIERALTLKESK